MVFTFAFVMIGLALMSMCISVIQCSIEDFYHRLLIEILEEYHLKMLEGKEKKSQNAFSRNRLAKLLLPFLRREI
jgi:hypothetical protein